MVLEERFGNPESLLKLANALNQASDDLWSLMRTLDAQASGLVPSGWDGRVASAFQRHWQERSKGIHDMAEQVRRAGDTLAKLGQRLQVAKGSFTEARARITGTGMWIQDSGEAGFMVLPVGDPHHPNQPAEQARVSLIWADAEAAWLEARMELAIDRWSIPDWMKNPAMGIARVPYDLASMVLHPIDTVTGIASTAWAILRTSAELSPEMAQADPELFRQRSEEVGKALNDGVKKAWDRPGAAITLGTELTAGLLVPGAVVKGARLLKTGDALDAAAGAREAATADGAMIREVTDPIPKQVSDPIPGAVTETMPEGVAGAAPKGPGIVPRDVADPIPTSVGDPIPAPPSSGTTAVVGRLPDTGAAADFPGHNVLNIDPWSIPKNDAWVQGHIDQGHDVYMASPLNDANLWDAANNRPTVMARELGQFFDAGYGQAGPSGTVAGDTLVPSARPGPLLMPSPPASAPVTVPLVTAPTVPTVSIPTDIVPSGVDPGGR